MTPTMALPALADFHRSMLACGARRAHFTIQSKGRAIGVDFYTDSKPFELVFSYKLFNPVLIEVRPGYRVPIILDDQYFPMRDLLGIESGGDGPWKPKDFLCKAQWTDSGALRRRLTRVSAGACCPLPSPRH